MKKLINCLEGGAKSITVDIFDTVLNRKIRPEKLQFYLVAKEWADIFKENIDETITVNEIYSFRNYSRDILKNIKLNTKMQGTDDEVQIEEWFSEIIGLLANKYNKKLTKQIINRMLRSMIDIELDIELKNLHVNKSIIEDLRYAKDNYDIKIFYISDMYLSVENVDYLLKKFKILDIFDDGVTSSEILHNKGSGKLYKYLKKNDHFEGFSLKSNVHIGDNYISDYIMPLTHGSDAIYYNNRILKLYYYFQTKIGYSKVKLINKNINFETRKSLKSQRRRETNNYQSKIYNIGQLFSLPLISYIYECNFRSQNTSDTNFIMVSSEALIFDQANKILFGQNKSTSYKFIVANKIKRKIIMRAVIFQIIKGKSPQYIKAINDLLRYGEKMNTNSETYKFLFAKDHKSSELLINLMSSSEFKKLLESSLTNSKNIDKKIIIANKLVSQIIPKDNSDIEILDLGWGGTIQIFLKQYLKLIGKTNEVKGIYYGIQSNRFHSERGAMRGIVLGDVASKNSAKLFVPEIWEYIYTTMKTKHIDEVQDIIHEGLIHGLSSYNANYHCSPDYLLKVSLGGIKRLLYKPTTKEIILFGNIKMDSGFNKVSYIPLVDFNHNRYKYLINSLIHPSKVTKTILQQYCWKMGTIRYYKLYNIFFILKLMSYIKKRRYI